MSAALCGSRRAGQRIEVDELAVELHVGAAPDRPQRLHVLVGPGPASLPRDAERVELLASSSRRRCPARPGRRSGGRGWRAPWPAPAGCAGGGSGCRCPAAASARRPRHRRARSSGSGIGVSGVAGILPSGVYGYADSMVDGKITCSPPHTDSKPSSSAARQISKAESWPRSLRCWRMPNPTSCDYSCFHQLVDLVTVIARFGQDCSAVLAEARGRSRDAGRRGPASRRVAAPRACHAERPVLVRRPATRCARPAAACAPHPGTATAAPGTSFSASACQHLGRGPLLERLGELLRQVLGVLLAVGQRRVARVVEPGRVEGPAQAGPCPIAGGDHRDVPIGGPADLVGGREVWCLDHVVGVLEQRRDPSSRRARRTRARR